MISYDPFWNTLQNSTESTYTLIHKHNISSNTLNRIRKNLPLTTTTIDDLCNVLKCNVQDILTHIPNET
ncbi:MAG: helix-turn-helix transcriptional regulator [Eubacterium sp.]|nr:helix-turn-helix transcriptional regulator [Eubacterium sp.]